MKPEDRGATPLRKLLADADANKHVERGAPPPALVSSLAKMSNEERTIALIKAVQVLDVKTAMWGIR
jgi:hypothetical protein